MNPAMSDKYLFDEVINLKDKYNCKIFIETGTWNGKSINMLSKHFEILKSIEIDESKHKEAIENNKLNKNVFLYCGNSSDILPNIINNNFSKSIFFLDAHWGQYWPLRDELQIIADFKITPIIMIHDFFVPDADGNPKFGYDKYQNTSLDYKYVEDKIIKIYGENKFDFYCLDNTEINAGTGIFTPK